jgi:hypothetical protein
MTWALTCIVQLSFLETVFVIGWHRVSFWPNSATCLYLCLCNWASGKVWSILPGLEAQILQLHFVILVRGLLFSWGTYCFSCPFYKSVSKVLLSSKMKSPLHCLPYSSIFSFLRDLHSAFHSGCTTLHSYQQCVFVFPISSHAFVVVLLIIPILTGVWGNLSVLFTCISYGQRRRAFFMCLLVICTFFWELSIQFIKPCF